MKKLPAIILGIIIVLVLLAAGGAVLFDSLNVVRLRSPLVFPEKPVVTFMLGKARVLRKQQELPVIPGMILKKGDRVVLDAPDDDSHSVVDIRFTKEYAITLRNGADFLVDVVNLTNVTASLTKGELYAKYAPYVEGADAQVTSATAIVKANRAADFGVKIPNAQMTEIYVAYGIAEIYTPNAPGEKKYVPQGYRMRVAQNEKVVVTNYQTVTTNTIAKKTVLGKMEATTVETNVMKIVTNYILHETNVIDKTNSIVISREETVVTNVMPLEPERMECDTLFEVTEILNQIHFDIVLFRLDGVVFQFDKTNILPDAIPTLEDALAAIKSAKVRHLRIDGHTDYYGSEDYNQKLSEERAKTVKAFLLGKGLSSITIDTKGYGESRPIADNGTSEGRRKNRRVEFVVLK